MKKIVFIMGLLAVLTGLLSSCKKTIENHYISKPYIPAPNPITGTTLGKKLSAVPTAYNGTLLANTTYNVIGDIMVNIGDTIVAQPGVTLCFQDTSCIVVKGVFISIGTQTSPVIMTDCAVTPVNTLGEPQASDPAWVNGTSAGWWSGIQCDTSCTLLVLKWTQVWFSGADFHRQEPCVGTSNGGTSYAVLFQRTNGNMCIEDCKFYGGIDDAIRVQTGQFEVMRSVFEKMGGISGDVVNVKSGGIGDAAYNLFIGDCTNGTKASNKGGNPVQCNMCMYNNTYVNCGYRQSSSGRGANIDYEQGAEGAAYNNLIVDCKFGFRIVYSPLADTAHCYYSNNFIYGDSLNVTEQFYPNTGYITKLGAYVAPIPMETGYVYNPNGSTAANVADATALMGENSPSFVNFPLPENYGLPLYQINNYEATNGGPGFNFRLTSNSPCINAGTTNFQSGYPINACSSVSVPRLGFVPDESAPCADIGCYPYTLTAIGNQQ